MQLAGTYALADLRYSATDRCRCGSGLAYVIKGVNAASDEHSAWYCGDWLLGRVPNGEGCAMRGVSGDGGANIEPLEQTKHDAFLFVFMEIAHERRGASTRPEVA